MRIYFEDPRTDKDELFGALDDDVFGDRPVRVLTRYPATWAYRFTNASWTPESLEQLEVTQEEAEESGITIVEWGTLLHEHGFTQTDHDGTRHCDIYNSAASSHGFYSNSVQIIEVAERLIVHNWGLQEWTYHAMNLDSSYKDWFAEAYAEVVPMCLELEGLGISDDTQIEDASEHIEAILMQRSSEYVQRLRNEIQEQESMLANQLASISGIRTQLQERDTALNAILESSDDITEEDVAREFTALARHAQIEHYFVAVEGDAPVVQVLTKPIPIQHRDDPEDTRDLGPFEITMTFGAHGGVKVRNLVNRIGEYDHPHVTAGRFCAGEWQPTVDQLLRTGEIGAAAAFSISCLGQVNYEDSWGMRWVQWFQADPNDVPTEAPTA